MRDANMIVRERQRDVRCAMDADDISLKAAAGRAGMPVSTFTSYFHGEKHREPATLNVAGLYKLVKGNALPLSMLSMLLPNGYQIVRASEEIDHDEIERLCREYLEAKGKAHRKDSAGGTEITEEENDTLTGCVVRLRAVA